jgi:antitoxin PrlF
MRKSLPGSKIAETMFTRPQGATMGELIVATGGPQYNVLKRLESRGYRVRRVKEGRETRYFLTPPAQPSIEVSVSPKGQLTLPKALREKLGVVHGGTVRMGMEESGRAFVDAPKPKGLLELVKLLPKAKRHVTLEEMDEGIAEAVTERYLRAIGKIK